MSNILDLYIQDFVMTNRILGAHVTWPTLVSRRFVESGAQRKIFSFKSSDSEHYAVGTLLELPDGDCFRIELAHEAAALPVAEDHRLDCLRMTAAATHTGQELSRSADGGTVIIRLPTRNRGLIPIVFVVRAGGPTLELPVLV
jgi:hypothetical protein